MLKQLGKYELRGTLGKGAMGTVYDAWDPGIARRVAIKTIPLPQGNQEAAEAYDRFRREAQAAGRLSHPGIIAVYDSGEAEGVAYIVMELIEGEPLKALLDREHRLAPGAAVEIMTGLLDALSYSHGRGVIHRDVKPTNIMLTVHNEVKIADFGIARIENSEMTQIGTIMGTPAYMSPEQFTGQAVDARTDIYSAGVVLYQLLTGEKPFQGGMTAIMHKALHTDPPRPSELSVTAPKALDAVVATAMARRPEDRYASAAAFSAALHAALLAGNELAEDQTTVLPASRAVPLQSPPKPVAGTAGPPRARARLPWLIGGTVTALALAGLAAFLLRPATVVQVASGPAAITAAPISVALVPPVPPPAPPPEPPPAPPPVSITPPLLPPESGTASPIMATVPTPPGPLIPVQPPSVDLAQPLPSQPLPSQPVPSQPVPSQPLPVQSALVQPPPMPLDPVQPPGIQQPGIQQPGIQPPGIQPPGIQPAVLPALVRPVPPPLTACTAVDIAITDSGSGQRVTVTGAAGATGPEAAARHALEAALGSKAQLDWQVSRFDGPYCPVVDLVRTLRPRSGPGFTFSLKSGTRALHDHEIIMPAIVAPAFAAHLRLTYFQQDGTVFHMVPAGTDPRWTDPAYPAGMLVTLPGQEGGGWPVGPPFGTDLMLAVMSSAPLKIPPRPQTERSETYLALLNRAIEAARRDGLTVLARIVVLRTEE